MTESAIGFICEAMESLGIPYEFMEFTQYPVPKSYFVGEYSEIPNPNEDGLHESQFIITGTTRGTWLELEREKSKIEKYFPQTGRTAILENNSGVAIFYDNAFPVPTGDAELKRIQINLTVKEWSVI